MFAFIQPKVRNIKSSLGLFKLRIEDNGFAILRDVHVSGGYSYRNREGNLHTVTIVEGKILRSTLRSSKNLKPGDSVEFTKSEYKWKTYNSLERLVERHLVTLL